MSTSSIPLIAAALLVGAGFGYIGGRVNAPEPAAPDTSPAAVPTSAPTPTVSVVPNAEIPTKPARSEIAAPEPTVENRVDQAPDRQRPDRVATRPDTSSARIAGIAQQRDPVARMTGLAELVAGLDASNARRIADAFRTAERGWNGNRELNLILDAWGRVDGAAALAYAQATGDRQAIQSAMTGWAMNDPAAARAWAMAQTEEADNPWMIPVINGVARTDLDSAVKMLYALPYGAARGSALDAVLQGYADRGMTALRNWVEQIPDERLRQGSVARAAPFLAREDPRRAADWAMQYAGAERLPQALTAVVATWASRDPAGATEWAAALEEGPARQISLEHAVGQWAQQNPTAAEAWLTQAGTGPELDRARMTVGMRYFQSDPVRAMSWISMISDEATKNRMLERIATSWSQRDPEAANRFLQSNP